VFHCSTAWKWNVERVAMGLGGYPKVTLAKARDDSAALRSKMKACDDVLAEKRAAQAKAKAAQELTFEVVAKLAHAARKGLADKTNALWFARLEHHAFPKFGNVAVERVDGPMVIGALEPIWHDKPETARRL
jgi:ribosomal protein S20